MKIWILTEGGKDIGLGHISRCSSLYDEIVRRGIEVDFLVYGDLLGIDLLNGINVKNVNWVEKDYLEKIVSLDDYVIIDSYKANQEIYETISKKSKKALYIDDIERLKYPKGIVVNPSLDVSIIDYCDSSSETILTGANYIILRSPFIGLERKDIRQNIGRVLIILGGTDIRNITSLIVGKLCKDNRDMIFDIILDATQVKLLKKTYKLNNINYYTNVTGEEMSKMMLKADLGITAAGQTIYELMATKTPFIAIQVIDNQKNNIMSIKKHISPKAVLKFDEDNFIESFQKMFEDLKAFELRKSIINNMNKLIDGLGRKRIVDKLLEEEKEYELFLRKAKQKDIQEVFELSNKEYVRRYSIKKNKIQWDDHVEWFNEAIQDKNIIFYVVTDKNETFLGQVRYKIYMNSATISISLSEKLKGKRRSEGILNQSIIKLFEENQLVKHIIAFVMEDNIASKKIFENLKFERINVEDRMLKLMLKREDFYANRSIRDK